MSAERIVRFLYLWLVATTATAQQDPPRFNPAGMYNLPDSYELSELPLAALLKVKRSVNDLICMDYPDVRTETCSALETIRGRNGSTKGRSSGLHYDQVDEGDQPSSRTLSDLTNFFMGDDHQPVMPPAVNEWHDNRKTYQEHGMWKDSGESGKIQKLFQFSVTALAFLAFGGYLLCMIVQAIKSKGRSTVYIIFA